MMRTARPVLQGGLTKSNLLTLLSDYLLIVSFTASSDRSVIAGTMATFHSRTCIRFVHSYVRINWANISPAMQYNFNKENTNNLNTPYDYSSVMHYGKTAFSINGWDTITPIPDASVQIGQRVDLSAIDILRINTLYGC
ncbi:high choriolytic enzyme 1-like [Colossoma macropomum]|uniref:high choriolytic enzyme 1-like n=1 Tax=Colossoma macropomum TaxID=42526 RepID=UPI001864979E|nr:high choriolytic enzyme 1-like [Colossoma macropomum]